MIQLPFRRSRPMHVALGGTCLFLVCAITAFFLHLSVSISDYSSEFPSLHGPQPPESDHVASDHPAEQNHATSSVASAPKATYSPARRPAIGSQTNQSQASNDHTNFDAQDYRMSFDQCGAAFGDLYTDLHRAASHRQKKGKVTPGDIDLGWRGQMGVRAMIFNSKVHNINEQLYMEMLTGAAVHITSTVRRLRSRLHARARDPAPARPRHHREPGEASQRRILAIRRRHHRL
jgi:hypothetical protein